MLLLLIGMPTPLKNRNVDDKLIFKRLYPIQAMYHLVKRK